MSTAVGQRSRRQLALRRGMLVLNVVGLGVAGYLTYVHYTGFQNLLCVGGHHGTSSCETVQSSVWSKLDGVPVALLGLIGYVAILASQLAPDTDESRLATLGLTLIGVGFSGYLTYRELFSIHAICEWCVSSAVILTLLFIGAAIRFVSSPGPLEPPSPPPDPAPIPSRRRGGRARAGA